MCKLHPRRHNSASRTPTSTLILWYRVTLKQKFFPSHVQDAPYFWCSSLGQYGASKTRVDWATPNGDKTSRFCTADVSRIVGAEMLGSENEWFLSCCLLPTVYCRLFISLLQSRLEIFRSSYECTLWVDQLFPSRQRFMLGCLV